MQTNTSKCVWFLWHTSLCRDVKDCTQIRVNSFIYLKDRREGTWSTLQREISIYDVLKFEWSSGCQQHWVSQCIFRPETRRVSLRNTSFVEIFVQIQAQVVLFSGFFISQLVSAVVCLVGIWFISIANQYKEKKVEP